MLHGVLVMSHDIYILHNIYILPGIIFIYYNIFMYSSHIYNFTFIFYFVIMNHITFCNNNSYIPTHFTAHVTTQVGFGTASKRFQQNVPQTEPVLVFLRLVGIKGRPCSSSMEERAKVHRLVRSEIYVIYTRARAHTHTHTAVTQFFFFAGQHCGFSYLRRSQ